MDREFDIYFFHIVINIETEKESWKWIHYKSKKSYATFPGIFETEIVSRTLALVDEDIAEEKCNDDSECVAIIKTSHNSSSTLMNYIDMDKFRKSDKKITLIKLQNAT